MITFEQAVASIDAPEVADLDVSMFTHQDIINLILQRSEILHDVERPGRPIREWTAGDSTRLDAQIEERGELLIRRAIAYIWLEFEQLSTALDTIKPTYSADIGCGYAIFDLFLAKTYGARLKLIDIETNEHRHFGYKKEGAAYTNLGRAHEFLTANGVAEGDVELVNPNQTTLTATADLDLVTSFVSCGFHYPLSTYETYFEQAVRPGGGYILDLRKRTYDKQMPFLESLGATETLCEASAGAALRMFTRRAA